MGKLVPQLHLLFIIFNRWRLGLLFTISTKWQKLEIKSRRGFGKVVRWIFEKIRLTGLKRYAYGIRFFDIEFLLKIIAVLGSGKLFFDMWFSHIYENWISLYIIPFIVFGLVFITGLYATIKQVKSWSHNVVEIENPDKLEPVDSNSLLTEKYLKNGYRIIREGVTQKHYIMSDEVNRVLYEDLWHRYISCCQPFILPEQCAYIAPYHLSKINQEKKAQGTHLYFSKLIGLLDDITSTEEDTQIRISNTNYFDFILTNEIVSDSYQPVIDWDREIIQGHKLLYNSNGTLRNFSNTLCADVLGGSTLAVTSDGYAIMQLQSSYAHRNPGTIVPSASGSTDYKDYKRLTTRIRGSHFCNLEGLTFQQLIIDTINRELAEENGFYSKSIIPLGDKVKTKVIGLARLLDRGAKPDFFGVTYIDGEAKELYPQMNASLGRVIHVLYPNGETDGEISCHILIPFQSNGDITSSVRDAMENVLKPSNHYGSSFQTGMLLDIIDTYYRDGIDLFGELQKENKFMLQASICQPADGEDGFGFSAEDGFAFVIDGATSLGGPGSFTAHDFTEQLKSELNKRLANKDIDIQRILLKSISAIKRSNPNARSAIKGFSKAGERQGPQLPLQLLG